MGIPHSHTRAVQAHGEGCYHRAGSVPNQLCKHCLFALQDVARQQGWRPLPAEFGHAG